MEKVLHFGEPLEHKSGSPRVISFGLLSFPITNLRIIEKFQKKNAAKKKYAGLIWG